ncbi:ABC transporter ATP-binding protein [Ruminococcus sp.]|jgi:ABC-2 type transport system ATP-binding protein|uniref:ABC transporter ATP-binding protein n=1 Tax=Ruminococcus sp. TaxID=41978 RepID=UPI00262E7359|nr:ABC transporter ATP-binding protein [Ruminococcus sp.]MEE0022885.1 ABC transporter ATP-binding protein [Ruminococcus sp.]
MVEIQNLTKYYGNKAALKGVSFTINENEVLGFLGPNGAGKSTTLNIVAGVIPSTGGTVKIQGYDIAQQPVKAKRCIGFLPEIPPVYPDMKVKEYLHFVAGLKGIPGAKRSVEVNRVMELLKITDMQKRLIRNLSKGYKQRVGFAQALLGDPPVLILDEPTVGLDPTQLMEVRNLILDLKHNHAIILSSHILGEISAVCDRIVVINHGEIKADDTIDNLEESMESGTVLRLKVQGSSREVPRVARAVEGVRKIGNIQFVKTGIYTYDVELEDESARNALLSALLQHQLEVLEVTTEKKNLEQVFVNLVNQPAKRAGLKDLLAEMEAEDSEAETAAKTDDAAKPESDAQNQEEE